MECLMCQGVAEEDRCLCFWGAAICSACEVRLMELGVDEPGYDTQVRAFRLLWQRRFLGTRDYHLVEGDQA
ncbi:MAG: hypothetical protein GX979_02120 [Firmicutes bacterium]|nr:hypothetical protein [Bacillota bacterium]